MEGGVGELKEVSKFRVDALTENSPNGGERGAFSEDCGFRTRDLGANGGDVGVGGVGCNKGPKNLCRETKGDGSNGDKCNVSIEGM